MGDVGVLSQRTLAMAPPDVIKKMKDFDGKGNIALFPLFGSDFIGRDAVILDDRMDLASWMKLEGKVRGKAKQPALDKLVHDFAALLRRKFRAILHRSHFQSDFEPSSEDLAELVHLWDDESLMSLSKLWEQSYNVHALRALVSFFDRVGGTVLPPDEILSMSKRDLCEFLVSIGMMYMSPEYTDGLVDELLTRRRNSDQSALVSPMMGASLAPTLADANFMTYQLAFIKAVLIPDEAAFEAAFGRSFAPAPESSSSASSSCASGPAVANGSMSLQSFRASLLPVPPAKKARIGSPIEQASLDIRGSAMSGGITIALSSCVLFILSYDV